MSEEEEKRTTLVIGVVALQGAFREHVQHIQRLNEQPCASTMPRLEAIMVRTPRELTHCDALIIPGGESTAIALGAQRAGLLEPLRTFVRQGRPVWGTCAGMILLAREASGIKKGGQELLGGIDVRVGRNGFGSQVDSFEQLLDMPALVKTTGDASPFPCVFIRAPVVESILLPDDIAAVSASEATKVGRGKGEAHEGFDVQSQHRSKATDHTSSQPPLAVRPNLIGRAATDIKASSIQLTISVAPPLEQPGEARAPRPPIEILATLPSLPHNARPSAGGGHDAPERGLIGSRPEYDSMITAIKQGNLMCTSFHPELTEDGRLHEYFVKRCVLGQE